MNDDHDSPARAQTDADQGAFGLACGTETWLSIARRAVAPLIIDQTIGGYELIAELGRGGQGVVYRAVQLSTGRQVAMKRLSMPLRAEASSVARFRREVDALVRLRHPNIVMLLDAEIIGDSAVLIMECLEGLPLGAWVAATEGGAPRPLDELVDLFLPICDAIVHAHAHGVIHCDLKPSNVMVESDGRPRVLDFGIARLYGPAGTGVTFSVSQSLAATPNWAAPEQFHADANAIDVRTDVYALGAILYFLLTGSEPFAYTTTMSQVLRAVEVGLLHPPSSARRDVDAVLDAIVTKAMDPDPARRHAAAAMLASDIRDWKAGRTPAGLPVRSVQRLRFLMRRRRRAMIGGAMGLALIVAGAGSFWIWSASRERMRSAEQLSLSADAAQHESRLRAANLAIRNHDAATAREHLQAIPPALRAWEWHMLMRRTDDSQGVMVDLGMPMDILVGHRDRPLLLVMSSNQRDIFVIDRSEQPWSKRPLEHDADLFQVADPFVLRDQTGVVFRPPGLWTDHDILHDAQVTVAAPDGRMGVIARGDRTTIAVVRVDQSGTGLMEDSSLNTSVKRTLDQPARMLVCVPSRGWVFVSCEDRSLRLLDLRTLEEIGRRDFDRVINHLYVNQDATVGVILGFTNEVEVVDLPSLETRHVLEGHREIAPRGACFLSDGRHLVTGSWDRTLRVWDLESGRSVRTMIGHTHYVRDVIGVEEDSILTASHDGTVRAWHPLAEPAHSRSVHVLSRIGSLLPVPACAISGDALPSVLSFGTSSSEAVVTMFRIDLVTAGRDPIQVLGIPHPTYGEAKWVMNMDRAVTLSRSGDRLAVADGVRTIRVLERNGSDEGPPWSFDRTLRIPLPNPPDDPHWARRYNRADSSLTPGYPVIHLDGPAAMAFTPDEAHLLCAMTDGTLLVMREDDGELVHSIDLGVKAAFAIHWIDEARALIYGEDTVAIVDIARGAPRIVARRGDFPFMVTAARASRDGRLVAMGFAAGEVWILPVHLAGEPLHRLRGSSAAPHGLDFSADGRRLAVASADARVRLWDVALGRELLTLEEHSLQASDVIFSSDGHWLISGGLDNMVWFRSGEPVE